MVLHHMSEGGKHLCWFCGVLSHTRNIIVGVLLYLITGAGFAGKKNRILPAFIFGFPKRGSGGKWRESET